ncbi:MAG TPA: tetratricopeptide repeat protein [Pyrinomonadaceae bacterium]|nr:tetratricopeptide repeat protein [Pyrinomonadaceae bacterium]
MKAPSMARIALTFVALSLSLLLSHSSAFGQDVGADVGGGAGIFRPRNPETKKSGPKPLSPVTKPSTKPGPRGNRAAPTATSSAASEERVEELLTKGNEFRDAKRFAEAESAYQGALKIKPRDARAAYGLGNVYTDQQRWESAETAYRNAAQWGPSNVDALVALSVVLVQPRTGGDNAKRFADAETFARRAVQLQPQNAVAWDRLGVALQSRGSFGNETEHAYRRAVELDPQFAVAYAHLGRVLKRQGRGSEAEPLYDQAITLAKDAATLNLVADSLQGEQQWERSGPVLKRALALDERNPTSLLLMGKMLVVLKRYQEAEPYLKTSTEVSPRAFQPFNLLGRTYLALERYADAEVTYERAATLAPAGDRKQLAGAFGFQGVGDGYTTAGEKSNAVRAYQRALELDPGNKDLEQKLSKARSR